MGAVCLRRMPVQFRVLLQEEDKESLAKRLEALSPRPYAADYPALLPALSELLRRRMRRRCVSCYPRSLLRLCL